MCSIDTDCPIVEFRTRDIVLFSFCRVTEHIRVAVKEPHRELPMSWSTALPWKPRSLSFLKPVGPCSHDSPRESARSTVNS